MTRMQLTIAMLFLMAFAAGAAVALSWRPSADPPPRRGSWLERELNLTPQQQQEMQIIWGEVGRENWQEDAERRRALARERDEAIRNLIPPERHAELEVALETYADQMAELSAQRRRAFELAVERTKAILTAEQRQKYEQSLTRRPEGGRPPGPRRDRSGPPGMPGGSGSGLGSPHDERER